MLSCTSLAMKSPFFAQISCSDTMECKVAQLVLCTCPRCQCCGRICNTLLRLGQAHGCVLRGDWHKKGVTDSCFGWCAVSLPPFCCWRPGGAVVGGRRACDGWGHRKGGPHTHHHPDRCIFASYHTQQGTVLPWIVYCYGATSQQAAHHIT